VVDAILADLILAAWQEICQSVKYNSPPIILAIRYVYVLAQIASFPDSFPALKICVCLTFEPTWGSCGFRGQMCTCDFMWGESLVTRLYFGHLQDVFTFTRWGRTLFCSSNECLKLENLWIWGITFSHTTLLCRGFHRVCAGKF
jgi:hypothetical protein